MKAVYGSMNDGSDIYKDKKGFYTYIFKSNADFKAYKLTKKYLPGFKPSGQIAYIRSKTKRRQSKKRGTTKKRHVK